MAHTHLESDKIFKNNLHALFLTENVFTVSIMVSHNMCVRHTCSEVMNNPG
jgi:hypothetical protein